MQPILNICVGHKSPMIRGVLDFVLLTPTDQNVPNQLIVAEDALGEAFHGSTLSEYTQLFWLADQLDRQGKAFDGDYLQIFQYRKLVSPVIPPRSSKSVPYSGLCSPAESFAYVPDSSFIRQITSNNNCFVGAPLRLSRSLAENYARYHLIEDFISLVRVLSQSEILSEDAISRFINCPYLIPAPSLSIIHRDYFRELMGVLKKVWSIFYENFYSARTGYQRRVGGFLLERLHSFLILERYFKEGSNFRFGKYITIVESGDVEPSS